MFGSSSLKIAASTLLVVSSSAVLVNLTQNSLAQRSGNNDVDGEQVAMQAPDGNDELESVVMPGAADQPVFVGQMGLAGGEVRGMAMGGGAPNNAAGAAPAPVVPQRVTPKEVVTWQRPESDTPNSVPEWLSGGASAQRLIERSRKHLSTIVNISATNMPLRSFVDQLASEANATMRLNPYELEAFGVDVDTPVSVEGEMPLREALRIILKPLELTYVATESGVEITSIDDASSRPNMRFYDLSYILPNSANLDALMNAIQQSIEPDSWLTNGGTGSIVPVGSLLVVNACETAHHGIEMMLLQIRQMNPNNASAAVDTDVQYGGVAPRRGTGALGEGGMGGMGGGMGGGMF